ncbi:PKD-like family lipoprotein [Carboxylicivirga sp. RSCT41]|uniref:PKD-like family lipoprotein n=1 Tax=Carboxylicivirga agarovorans TaxID=3417570 RepID=UPI003D3588D9
MKKILNIVAGFLVLLFAVACHDDMGNYDYNYMGDVYVTNFADANFSYKYGSQILIEPTILTNIPEKELGYMWLLNVNGLRFDTLSLERNLDVLAHFETSSVEFRVIHEPSGVHYTFGTQITVSEPFSSGWGFLSSTSSAGEFSFLSDVERGVNNTILWEYYPMVYQNVNDESLMANVHTLGHNGGFGQWIITGDDEGYILNAENMEKENMASEYFAAPEYLTSSFSPAYIGFTDDEVSKSIRFITTGGDLFAATQINYGYPFDFYAPISGEHYIGDKLTRVGNDMVYLVFDEATRRYLYVNLRNSNAKSQEVLKVDGTPDASDIDVNNLGMDCVYLKYAGISWDKPAIYSILKDDNGAFHLHAMDTNVSGPWDPNPYDIRINSVQNIDPKYIDDDTKIFIPDGTKNMFFVKGNQVHVYVGSNNVFVENWYEADDTILDFYFTTSGEFAVALSDGENSLVEIRSTKDQTVITTVEVNGILKDMVRI